jgi:hypothetical protein
MSAKAMKKLMFEDGKGPVAAVVSPRVGTPTSTGSPRRSAALLYINQMLRETPPETLPSIGAAVRASVPAGGEKSLIELTLCFADLRVPPTVKSKASSLVLPKIVSVAIAGQQWTFTLHVVCAREDARAYMPAPDCTTTFKTLDLALEEVASFWCPRGPFHNTPVSLKRVDEIVGELVRLQSHHLLDAIKVVQTMCICDMEAALKQMVARVLLSSPLIREMQPTTKHAVAKRLVVEGHRIAVLDTFSMRICKLEGVGFGSLMPPKWCVQPVRVVCLGPGEGSRQGSSGPSGATIVVTTAEGTEHRPFRELDRVLTHQSPIYCRFMLYDLEHDALQVMCDLEAHITTHMLRAETQDVPLDT